MSERTAHRWLVDGMELELLHAGYPYDDVQGMDNGVVVRKYTYLKTREAMIQKQSAEAR